MNSWILFQLVVDIALFALVMLYIIRERTVERAPKPESPPEPPDTAQLEELMDELARLVMRAEKAADRLDRAMPGAPEAKTASPAATPAPPKKQPAAKSGDPYADAARLIKKGLPDEEIGRIVGLPPHEISLIRNMAT